MKDTINCFLIDDDLDDQEIFCMALKDVDDRIKCSFANDGVEALDILSSDQSFVPDFIFMDLNMPRMNGFVCLEGILKIGRLDPSRIVMYSTTSDPTIIKKSKELGADDFLVKPPSLSTLKEKLAKIFKGTA